jgi:hypothetical protein
MRQCVEFIAPKRIPAIVELPAASKLPVDSVTFHFAVEFTPLI